MAKLGVAGTDQTHGEVEGLEELLRGTPARARAGRQRMRMVRQAFGPMEAENKRKIPHYIFALRRFFRKVRVVHLAVDAGRTGMKSRGIGCITRPKAHWRGCRPW